MKKMFIFVVIFIIFLIGCSNLNTEEAKNKLRQCYERKCELILEEEGTDRIELPYPFSFCYYESRKGCMEEVSKFMSNSFCEDFKYRSLCFEDLAVIKEDKTLCKPSKNDDLFKEYAASYPDKNEDELFEEFSRELEEEMDYLPCSQYYEAAIRTKNSGNSHCENKPSGIITAMPNLLALLIKLVNVMNTETL